MKLIIAGSRTLFPLPGGKATRVWVNDVVTVIDIGFYALLQKYPLLPQPLEVVSGCADGGDRAGECWALYCNIPVKEFPADWSKYGRSAGPRRNEQMAEYGDALLAFWDGKSPGTRNMVQQMRKRGKPVHTVLPPRITR